MQNFKIKRRPLALSNFEVFLFEIFHNFFYFFLGYFSFLPHSFISFFDLKETKYLFSRSYFHFLTFSLFSLSFIFSLFLRSSRSNITTLLPQLLLFIFFFSSRSRSIFFFLYYLFSLEFQFSLFFISIFFLFFSVYLLRFKSMAVKNIYNWKIKPENNNIYRVTL